MGNLFGGGGNEVGQEAIREASRRAEESYFKPFAVKSSAGSGNYDPTTGTFSSTLSQPYEDILGSSLGGAQNFFQQAQAFDPRQRGQEIFDEQSALLQPQFQQQAQQLQQSLFGGGRLGLRMAGESQGLGAGSGMVSPDALGLGRAQQQTLAQLAAGSRQQALGEQGQLFGFGTQLLGAGQGISDMERQLMDQGIDAEGLRAAAAYASGNLAMTPYKMAADQAEARKQDNAGMFGNIAPTLFKAGMSFLGSDIRLKENITQVGALPNGLGVYTWDWNDISNTTGVPLGVRKGVVAQEVLKVLPDAVIEHDTGYLMVDYSHPQLQGIY